MRNIPLSDLTVARAGEHTVISIGDHLRHYGPIVPHYYEAALDLSIEGFSRKQVACIMGLPIEEIALMATGNRPYPEAFQMQEVPAHSSAVEQRLPNMRVAKGRQSSPSSPQYTVNNNAMYLVADDPLPKSYSRSTHHDEYHSRHDDHHSTSSSDHDSGSSSSSSDGGGGGGGD